MSIAKLRHSAVIKRHLSRQHRGDTRHGTRNRRCVINFDETFVAIRTVECSFQHSLVVRDRFRTAHANDPGRLRDVQRSFYIKSGNITDSTKLPARGYHRKLEPFHKISRRKTRYTVI